MSTTPRTPPPSSSGSLPGNPPGESDLAADLAAHQLRALQTLVREVLASNDFYGPRLRAAGIDGPPRDVGEVTGRLGTTWKDELVADQRSHPPYGTNLTYPLERYVRLHQTSGTSGSPLRWLDTADSWRWMLSTWQRVFGACGIGPGDRVFFPFSFGPFLGFWTAFEAAWQMGVMALPGGGMSSKARLRVMLDNRATAVVCTPTYALRLAEEAASEGIDLSGSGVGRVIVAGEPGGSLPAVVEAISEAWGGARVLDHHGMTEVGPVSFPNPRVPHLLHVNERAYLPEVLDLETGGAVGPGGTGELVLTTLGRLGSPLIRYRTGDLVRVSERSAEELGYADLALEGGILARTDDMVVVRGVNLYPSAVDRVIRGFRGVAEYRVELLTDRSMAEVSIEVEPSVDVVDPAGLAARVSEALRTAFQLRVPVEPVARGTLPRFELKAKRWVRRGR